MKNVQLNSGNIQNAELGDWVKEANSCGYWKIVGKTPEKAIVKLGFDYDLTYARQSKRIACFRMKSTDLKNFQPLTRREISHIGKFFCKTRRKKEVFQIRRKRCFFFGSK